MFYYLSSNSSPPLPLHLPGLECAGSRAHDPLRGRRHSTYYPGWICSDGSPSRWGRSVGHKEAGAAVTFYEFNVWMWRYGRGQECKVSVAKAMEALDKPQSAFARREQGRAKERSGAGLLVRQFQLWHCVWVSVSHKNMQIFEYFTWHYVPAECAWTA
jgi:hypothetical protein